MLALRQKLPDGAGLRRHAAAGGRDHGLALLFFNCLTILPIAEATVLIFCAPLMIAPLARWLLGEKMRPAAMLALAVGFVGVLVTVQGAAAAAEDARRLEGIALRRRRCGALCAVDGAAAPAGAEGRMR